MPITKNYYLKIKNNFLKDDFKNLNSLSFIIINIEN